MQEASGCWCQCIPHLCVTLVIYSVPPKLLGSEGALRQAQVAKQDALHLIPLSQPTPQG